MKRDELFPSKYWKHEDLAEAPFVGRIAYVETEMLKSREGKTENKPIVHFTNSEKGLVLNLTNYNTIAEILGSEQTDDWRRAEIELFSTTTMFGNKKTGCIRVRAPQVVETKGQGLRRAKRAAPDTPQQDDPAADAADDVAAPPWAGAKTSEVPF
jgi:hypothetical protein